MKNLKEREDETWLKTWIETQRIFINDTSEPHPLNGPIWSKEETWLRAWIKPQWTLNYEESRKSKGLHNQKLLPKEA